MLNNTNQATNLASQSIIENFVSKVDPKECAEVLDDLFFEWVGSEVSDGTFSEYRASVVHVYRQIKDLLSKMESNLSKSN
jgi:hypothetical protein